MMMISQQCVLCTKLDIYDVYCYHCVDTSATMLIARYHPPIRQCLITYKAYIYIYNIYNIIYIYTRLYTCLTSIPRFALRENVTLLLLKLPLVGSGCGRVV